MSNIQQQRLREMQDKYLGKKVVYFGVADRCAPIDIGDLLEVCEVNPGLVRGSVRLVTPRLPWWVPEDEVKLLEEL